MSFSFQEISTTTISGNNPFDDEIESEKQTNVSKSEIDDYDPSLDPFADNDGNHSSLSFYNNIENDCSKSPNISSNKTNSSNLLPNLNNSTNDLTNIDGQNSILMKSSNRQRLSFVDDGNYSNTSSGAMDFDRYSLQSGNDIDSSLTQSRLSLQSNTSNTMIEQQLRQYSLGDGSLQKEGLLCPECMQEYRTITELMEHFDREHDRNNRDSNIGIGTKKISTKIGSSSWSSKNLTPLSKKLFSNDSSLVGDQIKGFLDKFLQSNVNDKLSITNNSNHSINSIQDVRNENNSTINSSSIWTQEPINPIQQWKHSMKPAKKRSHYEYFRQIRDSRIERYVFETNKLMIRLDKLLRDYPPLNDWIKRRRHEQSIVDWVDETIVPLCPSCANKFNIITRKRHHCRLCGAVMCTKCSEFISFKFAYELINPIEIDHLDHNNDNNDISFGFSPLPPMPAMQSTIITKNNIQQTNNDETTTIISSPLRTLMTNVLNSPLVNDNELIDKLRLCHDCKSLLIIRKRKLDVQHHKPAIVQLYQQLREQIQQIDRLVPVLFRMADSINIGESTYQLTDAQDLKHKLSKLGEQADLLSRKIETYGLTPSETEQISIQTIPSRQLSLQTSIRRSTIQYLREKLLGLPELPDEKHFEQLKQQHNQLIEKRIRLEKEMALVEQEKFRQRNQQTDMNTTTTNIQIGLNEDGFCPEQPNNPNHFKQWQTNIFDEKERYAILSEQNPIIQQMNIIRLYIKQAKNDHRYEEVTMLEENLRELEIEYYFSQQQQQQQSQSQQYETSESLNPFGDFDDDDNDQ
uniref:Rabenosyn-5-like n=1 Tax=Dermatophagoides pteronyssinus TaxID=6956 RepID=A0A6P6YAX3_DERPT|nr:rabenosyn-5-like [Dermatophagoides pteronyssinus]